jgi:hypothetical protein
MFPLRFWRLVNLAVPRLCGFRGRIGTSQPKPHASARLSVGMAGILGIWWLFGCLLWDGFGEAVVGVFVCNLWLGFLVEEFPCRGGDLKLWCVVVVS